MSLPDLRPTRRSFTPGEYPVRFFRSQSGAEARILYGNKRIGGTLELSYENITDTNAESFLTGYDAARGSFTTFTLPANAKSGWTGTSGALEPQAGLAYRYAEAPKIDSIKGGRSNVTVRLIAVTT